MDKLLGKQLDTHSDSCGHNFTWEECPYEKCLLKDTMKENLRYKKALRAISNINCGPDQASGAWKAGECEAMARDALQSYKHSDGLQHCPFCGGVNCEHKNDYQAKTSVEPVKSD